MFNIKLFSLLAVAAAATGFGVATFTASGCSRNCSVDCPVATVDIASPDNHELNGILVGLDVMGEACPPAYSVYCNGDEYTTGCTHVTITGQRPGKCDVLFEFSDRPNEIVHLQFGPIDQANADCCRAYPVIGPANYSIPDKPTGPIYSGGGDAGPVDTDAVTIVTDAGPPATGTDAAPATDAARDAGSDSLLAR
jgi:hypothetical protein